MVYRGHRDARRHQDLSSPTKRRRLRVAAVAWLLQRGKHLLATLVGESGRAELELATSGLSNRRYERAATGIEIGRVGAASLGDLKRSVARAREAQTDWAAVSFTERAAVMRRAADLWTQQSADVHNWLMREAGEVRLKAQYEVYGAVQECLESSELPSHALGEVLPTDRARLSMSRRTPVGWWLSSRHSTCRSNWRSAQWRLPSHWVTR